MPISSPLAGRNGSWRKAAIDNFEFLWHASTYPDISHYNFLTQFHYNAAVLTPSALQPESSSPSAAPRPDLGALAPEGLVALSQPETFGPETLSEKIDGKAELYLSAGFVQLLTQRFSRQGNPQAWLEFFLYDMGSSKYAFAVYSVQRREDGQRIDLGDFAYTTEDALFLGHGQYYAELIAPALGKAATEILPALGRGAVEKVKARREGITELALFPAEHLKRETISLLAAEAITPYSQVDGLRSV